MRRERGPLFQVVAVGVVLVLLALVLAPTSRTAASPVVAVVRVMNHAGAPSWLADPELWAALFNVVLFLPVGVLGVLVRPGWSLGRWALVGLVVSSAIELTQGLFLSGRDADPVDVLTNTVGTVLGAWLATRWLARGQHRT